MSEMPKCVDCGRFCRPAAWKMVYSGAVPTPDREIYKCAKCFEEIGPFMPQHGIVPKFSCGVFERETK